MQLLTLLTFHGSWCGSPSKVGVGHCQQLWNRQKQTILPGSPGRNIFANFMGLSLKEKRLHKEAKEEEKPKRKL